MATDTATDYPHPERRINAATVRSICGNVSDMTLWRWLDQRDFPKPVYIAKRRYWRESDIVNWLEAQAENA